MGCCPSSYQHLPIDLTTSVTPYYGSEVRGSAHAHVNDEAVSFMWTDSHRRILGATASIHDLTPGMYHVTVQKLECTAKASVQVTEGTLPVVLGYECGSASNEAAWDGWVSASVSNVDTHAYLWSNGQITLLPRLDDVRAGTYSVSVLDAHHRAVPHIHACKSVTVSFS